MLFKSYFTFIKSLDLWNFHIVCNRHIKNYVLSKFAGQNLTCYEIASFCQSYIIFMLSLMVTSLIRAAMNFNCCLQYKFGEDNPFWKSGFYWQLWPGFDDQNPRLITFLVKTALFLTLLKTLWAKIRKRFHFGHNPFLVLL